MITKFNIFERKDIELSEKAMDATNLIIKSINEDILTQINKKKSLFSTTIGNDNLYALTFSINKYLNITIIIGEGTFGGYYLDDMLPEIFIYDTNFIETLKKINNLSDIQDKKNTFHSINFNNVRKILYHELIHRLDAVNNKLHHSKKYKKKLGEISIYDKQFDIKLKKLKSKTYFKSTAEYNAHFLAAINYMNDEIKDGTYKIPDNFTEFKKHFINKWLINNFYDKSNSNLKKHFDKRIYDLYTKLK